MIERGGVFWTDFGPRSGSGPAKRRPVVVVQSDGLNKSRIGSAIVLTLTSNTTLADIPANVFVPASASGLPRDSVANVSHVMTVDRRALDGPVGHVPVALMRQIDVGMRDVLAL